MVSRRYYLMALKRKAFMAEMARALESAIASMREGTTDAFGECEEVLVEYRRRTVPVDPPPAKTLQSQMEMAVDRGALDAEHLGLLLKRVQTRDFETWKRRASRRS